jgi:GNAT superfamily N-acetyltransferase
MQKLTVELLRPAQRDAVNGFMKLYRRSFNSDERVSSAVLRRVMVPTPRRANPVHLFAAYLGTRLVGGACAIVLPAFSVVFGSYLFVDPELRSRGLGIRILRQVLRHERQGPHGWNWRLYVETTVASGPKWPAALASNGFRFFPATWPLISYKDPGKIVEGKLGYYEFRKAAPPRLSQPALLMYIHALFYGPDSTHRHLLPRLGDFVGIDA